MRRLTEAEQHVRAMVGICSAEVVVMALEEGAAHSDSLSGHLKHIRAAIDSAYKTIEKRKRSRGGDREIAKVFSHMNKYLSDPAGDAAAKLTHWAANLWMANTFVMDVCGVCKAYYEKDRQAWDQLWTTTTALGEQFSAMFPDIEVVGVARYMDIMELSGY